jgi:hypothetical protein
MFNFIIKSITLDCCAFVIWLALFNCVFILLKVDFLSHQLMEYYGHC